MNWQRRSGWHLSRSSHVPPFTHTCTGLAIVESEKNLGWADYGTRLHPGHSSTVPFPTNVSPQWPVGSLMTLWSLVRIGGLRSWGLLLWVPADQWCNNPLLNQRLHPPRGERRREIGGDFRRFTWEKSKIKGIYRDPAKDKLSKLTPQVLPWDDTNVHWPSLITVHSIDKFKPEIPTWDTVFMSPSGTSLSKNATSQTLPY